MPSAFLNLDSSLLQESLFVSSITSFVLIYRKSSLQSSPSSTPVAPFSHSLNQKVPTLFLFRQIEKQGEVLMEAYRSMSHELHRLQIEEEMLMQKLYKMMSVNGVALSPCFSLCVRLLSWVDVITQIGTLFQSMAKERQRCPFTPLNNIETTTSP
ncbi:hypothetical protein ZIOFF_044555 [Zingiber officinale]|uniref:Uncharacterized protein n=1 Tax=Zingiber officinale TaxID=94328 RepID=A0A8J5FVF7_ZINOF|nr:hypothetical protein ZIOFF_044555 [Zingiber officinale]